MPASPPPPPYYPSPSEFGSDRESLYGLKVGSQFYSHAEAFEGLTSNMFEAPPLRTPGKAQEFALSRKQILSDGTEKACAALYFLYSEQGNLKTIALTFAGEPCGSSDQAKASAEKIRAFLVKRMGPEMVRLDRIDAWAIDPIGTPNPEVAYAGAWGVVADGTEPEVSSAEDFSDVVDSVKGAVMTASVTRAGNQTMALVTVRLADAD